MTVSLTVNFVGELGLGVGDGGVVWEHHVAHTEVMLRAAIGRTPEEHGCRQATVMTDHHRKGSRVWTSTES